VCLPKPVKMTDNTKGTSLLQYGIYYGRKSFTIQEPEQELKSDKNAFFLVFITQSMTHHSTSAETIKLFNFIKILLCSSFADTNTLA
jgi:hypothetical protein